MFYKLSCVFILVFSLITPNFASNPDGLKFANPRQVGLSANRLEQVERVLQDSIDNGEIAMGAALVARRGKIAYETYVGYSDLASGAPLREDTIFRVASMTKAVTSVAAMMLYEEGRYLMNDPISAYIPAFANSQVVATDENGNVLFDDQGGIQTRDPVRPITVRDVLNHQAGMIYAPFLPPGAAALQDLYNEQGVAEIFPFRRDETLEAYVDRYASLPMFGDPGGEITYGVATDVVGRLVEVWSGQTLDEFFKERIFNPLGMNDTSFFLEPGSQKVDRLTTMYTAVDGTVVPRDTPEVDSEFAGPRKLYCGAAGLLSTPRDYFRFSQMILNGGSFNGARILSKKGTEMLTSNQLGDRLVPDFLRILGDQTGFGLAIRNTRGIWDGLESQGTLSFAGIYWTRYWIDPQEDLVVLVFTQAYNEDQSGFTHRAKNAAYQSVLPERSARFKE